MNAVLKGSDNINDYKDFGYEHNEMGLVLSLIHAKECENITIDGYGSIDFNSSAFFDYSKPQTNGLDLSKFTEDQKNQFGFNFEKRPNQMIFFKNCKYIKVENISLLNAACWGLVFSSCEIIKVTGVTIRYSLRLPNDDGIHLCSCKNVIITACDIVSGDDCIAITGIDDWMSESSNILISNCLLCSTSAGIRIGYWNSKVKDVQINNCTIYNSNRGICIMSCGSGLVEDIHISNLIVETKSRVGGWWGMGEAIYIVALHHDVHNNPGAEFDTAINEICVNNLTIRDLTAVCENGIVIVGDNNNIMDLKFHNLNLTLVDNPNKEYFDNKLNLAPGNSIRELPKDKLYWLYAENISNLMMSDVEIKDQLTDKSIKIDSYIDKCDNAIIIKTW